jgi:hypothetical protein
MSLQQTLRRVFKGPRTLNDFDLPQNSLIANSLFESILSGADQNPVKNSSCEYPISQIFEISMKGLEGADVPRRGRSHKQLMDMESH